MIQYTSIQSKYHLLMTFHCAIFLRNMSSIDYRNKSISSVQFSHSVMSDSLWTHELQHARPPCPSPTPRVHSNSRPSSQWYHPAISSSVVPFSSCPQSVPVFSSPVATAEFSKFAGILSAALSQHHLSGFKIAQLEFHHLH